MERAEDAAETVVDIRKMSKQNGMVGARIIQSMAKNLVRSPCSGLYHNAQSSVKWSEVPVASGVAAHACCGIHTNNGWRDASYDDGHERHEQNVKATSAREK